MRASPPTTRRRNHSSTHLISSGREPSRMASDVTVAASDGPEQGERPSCRQPRRGRWLGPRGDAERRTSPSTGVNAGQPRARSRHWPCAQRSRNCACRVETSLNDASVVLPAARAEADARSGGPTMVGADPWSGPDGRCRRVGPRGPCRPRRSRRRTRWRPRSPRRWPRRRARSRRSPLRHESIARARTTCRRPRRRRRRPDRVPGPLRVALSHAA